MAQAGHHIACLNALVTHHSNWKKDMVQPSPDVKLEGFLVLVDLTKQECLGLMVYGD